MNISFAPGKTGLSILLAMCGVFSASFACAQTAAGPSGVLSDQASLIEVGRYLATAADCTACHTTPKVGKPYAGGYSIESPLGAIYATNITPSKLAGIGNYTEAQFARALRQGIRADGTHLYPAMPYTAYAQLTDKDIKALYAYFMHAVDPVDEKVAQTELGFPFNIRSSMAIWNLLFLDDKQFEPDPSKDAMVNRGAYLANGLAHCSTCHTPRNALMAERGSQFLGGAALGAWHAPNITSDKTSGVGGWSDEELYEYLKTGRVKGKAQAGGQMAEAIENSLQHLSAEDLTAIIAYLRTVPAIKGGPQAQPAFSRGKAFSSEAELRGATGHTERDSLHSGAALFSANCASCHQANAAGSKNQLYPSLFHNTSTGGGNASNLVAAILFGIERKVGKEEAFMPRFDEQSMVNSLSDKQIAAISTYVLARYGNADLSVSSADVALARKGGPKPLLAKVQPFLLWIMAAAAVLLIGLVAWMARTRRNRRGRG